jgi:hypothetical protein
MHLIHLALAWAARILELRTANYRHLFVIFSAMNDHDAPDVLRWRDAHNERDPISGRHRPG